MRLERTTRSCRAHRWRAQHGAQHVRASGRADRLPRRARWRRRQRRQRAVTRRPAPRTIAAPVGVTVSHVDVGGHRGDAAQQLERRGCRKRQATVRACRRCRDRARPASRSRARRRAARAPIAAPVMSTIASTAPTSWKCTCSSVDAVHARFGARERLEDGERAFAHARARACAARPGESRRRCAHAASCAGACRGRALGGRRRARAARARRAVPGDLDAHVARRERSALAPATPAVRCRTPRPARSCSSRARGRPRSSSAPRNMLPAMPEKASRCSGARLGGRRASPLRAG